MSSPGRIPEDAELDGDRITLAYHVRDYLYESVGVAPLTSVVYTSQYTPRVCFLEHSSCTTVQYSLHWIIILILNCAVTHEFSA